MTTLSDVPGTPLTTPDATSIAEFQCNLGTKTVLRTVFVNGVNPCRLATNKLSAPWTRGVTKYRPKANPTRRGVPAFTFLQRQQNALSEEAYSNSKQTQGCKNLGPRTAVYTQSSAEHLLPPYTRVATGCGLSRRDCVSQMPKGKVDVGIIRVSPGIQVPGACILCIVLWVLWLGRSDPLG